LFSKDFKLTSHSTNGGPPVAKCKKVTCCSGHNETAGSRGLLIKQRAVALEEEASLSEIGLQARR